MRLWSSLCWLVVALGASSVACSSPPSRATPGSISIETAYRDSQPASSPAFEYLPGETRLVIAARSPAGLAQKIALQELITRNREMYERAVAAVTQLVGHNLLDPEHLPEVGLDPQKAFGLAALGNDAFVLFAAIGAHDRLQTALYRATSKLDGPLVPHVVAQSLIIAPGQDARWQLVIRGQTALLVLARDSAEHAAELARTVAAIDIDESLAARADFASAMADLRFGQDVAGYAVVPAGRSELARLVGIDSDVAVAFGAEIERQTVRVKASLPIVRNGKAAILRNHTSAPGTRLALASDSTGSPGLGLALAVDPSRLAAIPLAQEIGEVIAPLGLTVERDLVPLMTGEIGVAITSPRLPAAQDAGLIESLGITVVVVLADPRRAAELLASLARRPALAGLVRAGEPAGASRYTVSIPGGNDLDVGITGSYFYAATDRDLAARLGRADSASPAPGEAAMAPPIAELFGSGSAALRLAVASELLGYLLLPGRMAAQEISLATAPTGPDPDEAGSGPPLSATYLDKKRSLDAARAAAAELERAARVRMVERTMAAARTFGTTTARVVVTRDGLTLYTGQFFGASNLVDAVTAARALDEIDASAEEVDLARLRVRALEEELAAIRANDIAEYERSGTLGDDHLEVTGNLDADNIRTVMRRSQAQLRACYERELADRDRDRDRDRSIGEATVQADFTIGGNGKVLEASATGGSERMNLCIGKVLEGLRFATPRGGGVVKVRYPLRFRPVR